MKYFKPNKDWEFNSRILRDDNKWLYYAEGYKIASDLIEKQVLEIDRTNQDMLIYPYCYLVRHFIESSLKEIVFEGCKITGQNPVKLNHDLSQLWKIAQDVLKNVWKAQYQAPPKDVEDFINEFHSIDVKSDSFRYPIDKNGDDSLEKISEINFKDLVAIVTNVKDYLSGITDGLAVAREVNGL